MQGKKIDKFTLVHLIGEGGLAEVWYAENHIGLKAAVKILKKDFSNNTDIINRFENEARVMVKLSHPNIRRVFDYDTINSRPAIVMEYLDGEDLSHKLTREGSYTQEDLLRWWNSALEALHYIHKQGVVHRDIKPSNLFITSDGDLKLLDFGISKVADNIAFTKTNTVMGTPLYMSPEQVIDSKHIDCKSDLYSLAVSFFHLLSREKPYGIEEEDSMFHIQTKIVNNTIDCSSLISPWDKLLPPLLAKQADLRAEARITTEIAEDPSPNPPSPHKDEKTIIEPVVPPTPKPNLEKKKAVAKNKTDNSPLIGCLVTILFALLAAFVLKYYGNTAVDPIQTPDPTPSVLLEETAAEKVFKSIEWVDIPEGSFLMGSPENETGRYTDEGPQHNVSLFAFNMSAHTITFEQYDAFCDITGRKKPDDEGWGREKRPVINVSWEDAVAFAAWLGKGVRLPTEAEWEYACRAGSKTAYYFGDDAKLLKNNAWYLDNAQKKTHPVGQKRPNNFGIYDMYGNVWEWCSDWFDKDYYSISLKENPQGPSSARRRVIRGGCWESPARKCRSASRNVFSSSNSFNYLGFRLVCPK